MIILKGKIKIGDKWCDFIAMNVDLKMKMLFLAWFLLYPIKIAMRVNRSHDQKPCFNSHFDTCRNVFGYLVYWNEYSIIGD